jgi:hypothetical protein
LDYYDPQNGLLAGLKASRDASPETLAPAAWNYGYFRQFALYAPAFEHLGPEVREVLVINVEDEAPKAGGGRRRTSYMSRPDTTL